MVHQPPPPLPRQNIRFIVSSSSLHLIECVCVCVLQSLGLYLDLINIIAIFQSHHYHHNHCFWLLVETNPNLFTIVVLNYTHENFFFVIIIIHKWIKILSLSWMVIIIIIILQLSNLMSHLGSWNIQKKIIFIFVVEIVFLD